MLKDKLSELKKIFRSKSFAYQKVFDENNLFTKDVMKDLAKFCRANDSTFNKDPRIQANLDGRREVFLRIQNFLNLSQEEIYKLHHIKE